MTWVQFYGVLATTASVFVGILTAYLVTRLSDLKSERARLRRRVESIDAELRVLKSRHEFRLDRLEETEERWKRENAEEHVDNFIEYTVGRDWNPSREDVTVRDAVDAMVEHQDLTADELIQHHVDMIEERWGEIVEELQPRDDIMPPVDVSNETYTAANWIIDQLWEIYDREKYDTHDAEALNIQRKAEELEDEREVLAEQFESLDPSQLRDSIKAAVVPIGLSVVLPLLVRFLHELNWTIEVPSHLTVVEPTFVLLAWLVGFFWTLRFVWVRVTDTDGDLPESPISGDGLSSRSEGGDEDETEDSNESEDSNEESEPVIYELL